MGHSYRCPDMRKPCSLNLLIDAASLVTFGNPTPYFARLIQSAIFLPVSLIFLLPNISAVAVSNLDERMNPSHVRYFHFHLLAAHYQNQCIPYLLFWCILCCLWCCLFCCIQ